MVVVASEEEAFFGSLRFVLPPGFLFVYMHPVYCIRGTCVNFIFPVLWVSRVAGNDSYAAPYIGRPEYPYATIKTAYDALPGSGTPAQKTGTIMLRAGPPFDATGAISGFPSNAEYQVFDSTDDQLIVSGHGVKIIGAGGNKERGGNAENSSNLIASSLIIAATGFPADTALIQLGGEHHLVEGIALKNTISGGIGVQILDGKNCDLRHLVFSVCTTGLDVIGPDTDNNMYYELYFALCSLYGAYLRQEAMTTSPNNQVFDNCKWYWCGSRSGTPTGADLLIQQGTSGTPDKKWATPNNIVVRDSVFFGGAYGIDIQGGHSIDIYNNQFEMADSGIDGPVLDRPVIRVGKVAASSGVDFRSFSVHVHDNYMHEFPDTSDWSGNVPVHFEVDSTERFVAEDNQHFGNLENLTEVHPLLRFGASSAICYADLSEAFDTVNGRSDRPAEFGRLVIDDSSPSSNYYMWTNPNG